MEPRNPASSAEAIIALLTDEARRRSMGEKGREGVLVRHDIQHITGQTERVLWEAARDRGL